MNRTMIALGAAALAASAPGLAQSASRPAAGAADPNQVICRRVQQPDAGFRVVRQCRTRAAWRQQAQRPGADSVPNTAPPPSVY